MIENSQSEFVPVGIEDNVMVIISGIKKEFSNDQDEKIDDHDWEVEGYDKICERYNKDFGTNYP